MDLLKITQTFEMTQQIRTISRANGLRRLTIIIAYHNRGNIARRSSTHLHTFPSRSSKFPRRILPLISRKASRHVDQRFSTAVGNNFFDIRA